MHPAIATWIASDKTTFGLLNITAPGLRRCQRTAEASDSAIGIPRTIPISRLLAGRRIASNRRVRGALSSLTN